MFVPSSQQMAVSKWVKEDKGSLNLVARAGCGKTSTLVWLLQFLEGWVFFGAYNKAIAMEIKDKVSKLSFNTRQIDAGTIHSAGFKAIMKVFPKTKVKSDKVWQIIDEMAEESETMSKTLEMCNSFIAKSVSIAKQRAFGFLCGLEDQSKWYDLVEHFGLEEELPESGISLDTALELTIRAFKRSVELDPLAIDFDDMILSPLIHKANLFKRDWVLIDEAQDTNPARRALAMAMLQPKTGRLIAVGDPAQAIYGFTGADSDSMDLIKEQLNSKVLPLNLTYRCPKAIVTLAQTIVPDIEAHETAPEGSTTTIALGAPKVVGMEDQGITFWSKYAPTLTNADVVLCRNTKPLVEMAYALIRNHIGCFVEGRDIGSGLIKLANRWKVTSISALSDNLLKYKEREIQKWQAKNNEVKAAQIEDQVDTLVVLIDCCLSEGKRTMPELTQFINSLFGDTEPGCRPKVLTLSTIHKSKGREWTRVFILGRNKYMPSKWARKEWQMTQESNLEYVAITRAKSELIDINA